MLEIHGIPVTTDECTNSLVIKVVSLIDPDLVLTKEDISTSQKKSEMASSQVFSFSTLDEFQAFDDRGKQHSA